MTESTDPPKFLEGDKIEFEIVKISGSALPRWDYNNNDNGTNKSNPVMAHGEVDLVTPEFIHVKYEVDGYTGTGKCKFPYYDNKTYSAWQWSRKGYLKKTKITKCECGSGTVYGSGTNLHSFWCVMSKRR